MKNKLKTLLSGFLVLSMVTAASPISLLANEIPENAVATIDNSSLPTGILALNDDTIDGKSYDFSYIDYSPHYYTTDSGSIYISIMSHKPDKQSIRVRLLDGDFGVPIGEDILIAPDATGAGVGKFNNLDKNKLYYLEFLNYNYQNPDTTITGTLFVAPKDIWQN